MNVRISYNIDSEQIPHTIEKQIEDAERRLTITVAQIVEVKRLISGKDADHVIALGRLGSVRTMLGKADLTLDNAMNLLESYMTIVAPTENPNHEADEVPLTG